MCGICGRVNLDGVSQVERDLVVKMTDVLGHRGPDGSGYLHRPEVALGNRRLSIIDLSTGDQPIHNESETVWVTFNGEIYNYPRLREDLERRGHVFYTESDTEVIVHLYEDVGRDCVTQLRGMFAFALWDDRSRSLLLARDRLGKKPLYYAWVNGSFIFGSEMKSLLVDPHVQRRIDLAALDSYFTYACVPPPGTIFQDIQKLPPAHTLLLDSKGIILSRYWSLTFSPRTDLAEEEAIEEVTEKLREATRLRLISDVPLGAFLSGGVDSSVIVALMSALQGDPVKTFSIGFEHQGFNEIPHARAVAQQFGTDHHEFIVKVEAARILPELTWYLDEPFADPSAIPTYYVSKCAVQHVKVALNGDGGDEAFAGYGKYLGSQLRRHYRLLPVGLRRSLVRGGLGFLRESMNVKAFSSRLRRLNDLSLLPRSEADIQASVYNGLYRFRASMYTHEFLAGLPSDPLDYVRGVRRGGPSSDLEAFLYADLMTYLPDDLLVKADRMAMANSLEGRSPLLDHEMIELAATIPAGLKIKGRTLKYVLRRVGQRLGIPWKHLIRYKQGFEAPIAEWLRGEMRPLVKDLLSRARLSEMGYLRQEVIDQLVQNHQEGRANHAERLWSLLCFELWYNRFRG